MQNFKLEDHGETISVEFIRDFPTLKNLCQQWLRQEAIAIDTEFDRTNTYFHNLALIQIFDGKQIYFIDPLELSQLEPLAEVFESFELVKILHSCSEDLEALFNQYHFKFNQVFDSQIAASFLDMGASIGYLRLIELMEGISLDKGHTKTDWLQRPLTQEQLIYAAQDVQFLFPVYFKLRDKLLEKGHFDYVLEDSDSIFEAVSAPQNYDDFYLRIKGAYRLNRQQLNRLKNISSWREQLARLKNIPRTFIFRDHQLLEICQRNRPRMADLLEVGCHRASIRRYGSELLALIEQADSQAAEHWPNQVLAFHKLPQAKQRVKQLKVKANQIATSEQIPEDVLSNKRLIEYYVQLKMKQTCRANRFWNDWRKKLLVDTFEQTWAEMA